MKCREFLKAIGAIGGAALSRIPGCQFGIQRGFPRAARKQCFAPQEREKRGDRWSWRGRSTSRLRARRPRIFGSSEGKKTILKSETPNFWVNALRRPGSIS